MTTFPSSLLHPFLNALQTPPAITTSTNDHPNYYINDPSTLSASSQIKDFSIATGASLYSHFQSVLLSTQHSLTIVTCFWARSKSLETVNHVLRTLSSRALHNSSANGNGNGKIHVRICFSSLSVTQKLFHTRSLSGQQWPPATWVSKLGLPPPSELTGLDLEIKSIFVLPFSVMHPKFIIVDGHTVLLPSCNVSWEDWCEGCVQLSGDIVCQFVRFYNAFWADADAEADTPTAVTATATTATATATATATTATTATATAATATTTTTTITAYDNNHEDKNNSGSTPATPSLFLPSPHHANPNFNFPLLSSHHHNHPPPTPLNTFILTALAHAKRSVVITTPNLTSPPLIAAVLDALQSGVDITIYTSARMMLLEQIVTAGTITEWCVWRLRRKYRKLQQKQQVHNPISINIAGKTTRGGGGGGNIFTQWFQRKGKGSTTSASAGPRTTNNDERIREIDIEQQMPLQGQPQSYQDQDDSNSNSNSSQQARTSRPQIGQLKVFYFTPRHSPNPNAHKLHFKCTIIDDEFVVLGSGNMDRASWYTSQELGVAFASGDFARRVQHQFTRFLTVSVPTDSTNNDRIDLAERGEIMQVRRVI